MSSSVNIKLPYFYAGEKSVNVKIRGGFESMSISSLIKQFNKVAQNLRIRYPSINIDDHIFIHDPYRDENSTLNFDSLDDFYEYIGYNRRHKTFDGKSYRTFIMARVTMYDRLSQLYDAMKKEGKDLGQ